MREYNADAITGDRYGAHWTVEAFAKAGVRYVQSERDRSAVYMDTLPSIHIGPGADCWISPKWSRNLPRLSVARFSTGRERMDPGPGHDDCANSAAIALSLAAGARDNVLHVAELRI